MDKQLIAMSGNITGQEPVVLRMGFNVSTESLPLWMILVFVTTRQVSASHSISNVSCIAFFLKSLRWPWYSEMIVPLLGGESFQCSRKWMQHGGWADPRTQNAINISLMCLVHVQLYFEATATSAGQPLVLHLYVMTKLKAMMKLSEIISGLSSRQSEALLLTAETRRHEHPIFKMWCNPSDVSVRRGWRGVHLGTAVLLWRVDTVLSSLFPHNLHGEGGDWCVRLC